MARDAFIKRNRCTYCDRTGVVVWDTDLFSCNQEVCKTLAFAEVRRRHRNGGYVAPEKRLAKAILTAFDTLEYAVQRDERAELLPPREADAIRSRERQQTAYLLSELRELERRYPEPAEPPAPAPSPPNPRYRRFVKRGRTITLGRDRAAKAAQAEPVTPGAFRGTARAAPASRR